MGQSVLVFISHSSEDKGTLIEPIAADLENCFVNVWLDKKKIVPGDNLRKSIFSDGLDKADVALLFFTKNSLKSSWVDREIKHVLREEHRKGNNFDLNKIISIFDSQETYEQITKRYPELTDDLLHLMPVDYNKLQLGQLLSAIWSKHLSLQGGDVEIQRQLLAKEREVFQRDKEIQELKTLLKEAEGKDLQAGFSKEFEAMVKSGRLANIILKQDEILSEPWPAIDGISDFPAARAFGLMELNPNEPEYATMTEKGREFFSWYLLSQSE